jgi:hypothetical protein
MTSRERRKMGMRKTPVNPSELILRASMEEQWPSVAKDKATTVAWAFEHHPVVENLPHILSIELDGQDHLAVLALEQELHAATCAKETVDTGGC